MKGNNRIASAATRAGNDNSLTDDDIDVSIGKTKDMDLEKA